jgi:hypothetical protein
MAVGDCRLFQALGGARRDTGSEGRPNEIVNI